MPPFYFKSNFRSKTAENPMKKVVLSTVFSLASFILFSQGINDKYIEVTGRSRKEITPDNLEVTITIREAENVKRENDLVEREKQIMQALRQFSIQDADIAIDKIAGTSGGYYSASNRYHISKVYKVQLKDITIVDNLIVKLFEAGANDAQITKLSNKNIEKLKSEAAQEAVENGKLRAEAIAKSLNISVGNAVKVIELGPVYQEDLYDADYEGNSKMYRAAGAVHRGLAVETENVNIKKIVLSYNVAIRFEIR
jgi:uncharacterized protein